MRKDDRGSIVSVELVLVATIGIIGLLASLSAVRDSVAGELSDVAGAVQDVNQSYLVNGVVGHSATTAGTEFLDMTDHCDNPDDAAGTIDNCIVFSDPANEDGGPTPPSVSVQFEAESGDVQTSTGGSYGDGWNLWSDGELFFDYDIPEDGIFTFCSRLWGQQGGPDLPNASLLVDNVEYLNVDVPATSHATADVYCVDVFLPAGTHQFGVRYNNDLYDPANGIDRNLMIDWVSILGPN